MAAMEKKKDKHKHLRFVVRNGEEIEPGRYEFDLELVNGSAKRSEHVEQLIQEKLTDTERKLLDSDET